MLRIVTSLTTLAVTFALAFAPSAALAQTPVSDKQYVLRFGDTLNMKVVENEKLEIKDQPIRPDGRISLPLIGELQAGGLTLPQLSERISKAYGKFFVDPHVVINVAQFRPIQVTVLGKVNNPGTFPVKEPVRLLQAIALAGGFDTQRSELSNVLVLNTKGETKVIDVNKILNGALDDNIVINDGDTVRVAEVGTPDIYRILPPLASALSITSTIVVLLINLSRQ